MAVKPLNVDPAGVSGGILPDVQGTALDIGYKRMGIEKADEAKKAAEQKEQDKFFELDYKPVWEPGADTILNGPQGYNDTVRQLSNLYAQAKQAGLDPRSPGNPYFHEVNRLKAQFTQNTQKQLDKEKAYNNFRTLYDKDPNSFRPETFEEYEKFRNDPNAFEPPDIDNYLDWMTGLNAHINSLKDEEIQKSWLTGTGTASLNTLEMTENRIVQGTKGYLDAHPEVVVDIDKTIKDLYANNPEEYKRIEDSFIEKKAKDPELTIYDVFASDTQLSKVRKDQVSDITYNQGRVDEGKAELSAQLVGDKWAGIAEGNTEMYKQPDPDHTFTLNGEGLEWTNVATGDPQKTGLINDEGKEVFASNGIVLRSPSTGKIIPLTQKQLEYMQANGVNEVSDVKSSVTDPNVGNAVILEKDEFIPYMIPTAKKGEHGIGIDQEDLVKYYDSKGVTYKAGTTKGTEALVGDLKGKSGDEYVDFNNNFRTFAQAGISNARNGNPTQKAESLKEAFEAFKKANGGKLPYFVPSGTEKDLGFMKLPGSEQKVYDPKDIDFSQSGDNITMTITSQNGEKLTKTFPANQVEKVLEIVPNIKKGQITTTPQSRPAAPPASGLKPIGNL